MASDDEKPAVKQDGAAGNKQQERRAVSKYQASPEEQAWFARTYSSDIVIMPLARRQRPSTTPKKADDPEVLPTIKRDEGT